jgi:hypothetical protein
MAYYDGFGVEANTTDERATVRFLESVARSFDEAWKVGQLTDAQLESRFVFLTELASSVGAAVLSKKSNGQTEPVGFRAAQHGIWVVGSELLEEARYRDARDDRMPPHAAMLQAQAIEQHSQVFGSSDYLHASGLPFELRPRGVRKNNARLLSLG